MPNQQIYFHAGAERTGTKYVQGKVFPLLRDICFINRREFHKADQIIAKKEYSKYLISYELNFKNEFEEKLVPFAQKYPDAKIIMVFRNQAGWIESQYKRLIKNGHNIKFEDYLDVTGNKSIYKTTNLLYLPKIKMIQELFHQKPLLLPYEELRRDPIAFTDVIANYVGVTYDKSKIDLARKHTSYNQKQLSALKKTMRFITISRRKISKFVIVNFAYRLYVDAIRYSVFNLAKYLPDSITGNEPLMNATQKQKVSDFYQNDWEETLNYIENNKLNKAN